MRPWGTGCSPPCAITAIPGKPSGSIQALRTPTPLAAASRPTRPSGTQHLFVERKPYTGYDANDIRAVFFDHELILSLGCESILNLPVCDQGQVIGTLNLLHGEHWYDKADIALGQVFAALALPAFLALQD